MSWTRYVLLFCIFFLFLMGVLNLAAPFGTPRLPMLVSSLVSALALVVSSAVFSWFIGLSTRLSLVYGSLVSLIILLLWLYLCGADPVFGDCVYQCVVPAAKKIQPHSGKTPPSRCSIWGRKGFLLWIFGWAMV